MKSSRREFFTLLAAAPLVAPAVVRGMAAPPGISSGAAIPDYTAAFLAHQAKFRTLRFKDWTEPVWEWTSGIDEKGRRYTKGREVKATIPNRLYGAQINADGDAV